MAHEYDFLQSVGSNYSDLPNTLRQRVRKYNVRDAARTIPWVYAAVDARASAMAGVPIKFLMPTNGTSENALQAVSSVISSPLIHTKTFKKFIEEEKLSLIPEQHPVQILFKPPKKGVINSIIDLNYLTYIVQDIVGEIFWIFKKKDKIPVNIDLQSSYVMSEIVSPDGDDLWGWKKISGSGVVEKEYQFEDLIQFKHPNPYSDWRGLSPILAGRISLEQWFNMAIANAGQFADGAIQNKTAIIYPNKVLGNSEQERQFQRKLETNYSGFINSNKPLVLDGNPIVQNLFDSRDLNFLAGQGITREEIVALWHVPPGIVGILQYANYANLKEQNKIFWTIGLVPSMNSYKDALQVNLLDEYFPGVVMAYDFDGVEALREDPMEVNRVKLVQAQTANTLTQAGYGKDQIADIIGNPKFKLIEIPVVEVVPGPEEVEETLNEELSIWHYDGIISTKISDQWLAEYARRFEKTILDPLTNEMVKFIAIFLNEMTKRIWKSAEENAKMPVLLNALEWQTVWNDLVPQILMKAATQAMNQVYEEIEHPKSMLGWFYDSKTLVTLEKLLSPQELAEVQKIIKGFAGKTKLINGTVDELNRVALHMIKEGATPLELRMALEQAKEFIWHQRSDGLTVARTMINGAYSGVRQFGKQALGAIEHAWACSEDAAVRPTHVKEHGHRVKVGELFPVTHCKYPLDPEGPLEEIVNCRCSDVVTAVKPPIKRVPVVIQKPIIITNPLKQLEFKSLELETIGQNEVHIGVLEDGTKGVFKKEQLLEDIISRQRREELSYEISKALNMEEFVPETVFRDSSLGKGSFQKWVENLKTGAQLEKSDIEILLKDKNLLSKLSAFDDLIVNSDRHLMNWGLDDKGHFWFIDNERSFGEQWLGDVYPKQNLLQGLEGRWDDLYKQTKLFSDEFKIDNIRSSYEYKKFFADAFKKKDLLIDTMKSSGLSQPEIDAFLKRLEKGMEGFADIEKAEFYKSVGEHVGANEPLNLEKFKDLIPKYSKDYSELYRVWQDYTKEDFLKKKSISIAERTYYATSKDLEAILKMCEMNDLEDGLIISSHSGVGLDVSKILEEALTSKNLNEEELQFIKTVLVDNKYQKEVLFLEKIKKLDESNVLGYYDASTNSIIKFAEFKEKILTGNKMIDLDFKKIDKWVTNTASECYKGVLEDGTEGIFKKELPMGFTPFRPYEIPDPAVQALLSESKREALASEVAKILKFDKFVPETVFRESEFGPGSFQKWVKDLKAGRQMSNEELKAMASLDLEETIARAGAFDDLINSVDRHDMNWGIDKKGNVYFIDNGKSFFEKKMPQNVGSFLDNLSSGTWKTATEIRQSWYYQQFFKEAAKKETELRKAMNLAGLSQKEINAFIARLSKGLTNRDNILDTLVAKYFDKDLPLNSPRAMDEICNKAITEFFGEAFIETETRRKLITGWAGSSNSSEAAFMKFLKEKMDFGKTHYHNGYIDNDKEKRKKFLKYAEETLHTICKENDISISQSMDLLDMETKFTVATLKREGLIHKGKKGKEYVTLYRKVEKDFFDNIGMTPPLDMGEVQTGELTFNSLSSFSVEHLSAMAFGRYEFTVEVPIDKLFAYYKNTNALYDNERELITADGGSFEYILRKTA